MQCKSRRSGEAICRSMEGYRTGPVSGWNKKVFRFLCIGQFCGENVSLWVQLFPKQKQIIRQFLIFSIILLKRWRFKTFSLPSIANLVIRTRNVSFLQVLLRFWIKNPLQPKWACPNFGLIQTCWISFQQPNTDLPLVWIWTYSQLKNFELHESFVFIERERTDLAGMVYVSMSLLRGADKRCVKFRAVSAASTRLIGMLCLKRWVGQKIKL